MRDIKRQYIFISVMSDAVPPYWFASSTNCGASLSCIICVFS